MLPGTITQNACRRFWELSRSGLAERVVSRVFTLHSKVNCEEKMFLETVSPSRTAAVTDRPDSAAERSSAAWSRYFRRNGNRLLHIPWERGAELSARERVLVASSLPVFQQGEGQEGGHFFACARAYAERTGDGGYVEAHRLFMAEERRHARDPARF